MKGIFSILLCVFLCGFTMQSSNFDVNAKKKAVYIYNFSKYFDWPSNYKQGTFTIGILGDAPALASELVTMSATKKVGSQDIEVKEFKTMDALNKCHILYVTSDNSAAVSKLMGKIKGASTLLVTDKDGLTKLGASINFVIQNNKVMFELSKSNASKQSLTVSSQLESLAIKVD